jgi:transposase
MDSGFAADQEVLFAPIPVEKMDVLTREELVILLKGEQDFRLQLQRDNARLRALHEELKQKSFLLGETYITVKNKYFGRSSEREATPSGRSPRPPAGGPKRRKIQLPSERYPNAPLIERHVEFEKPPTCRCCGKAMKDSGMTEDSEFLTVVPAEYLVVRQRRHKYTCAGCYGDVQTAPAPPTIKPGSSYSDEMKVDVALSKYCDLIPVERYAAIAGREGLEDLPPQSLIESTHQVADFVKAAYDQVKAEVLQSRVLHADETPHRMLEGDEKKSWYLWGFSNEKASYLETHDTRSGDVASDFLAHASCRHLVSDVYSGYGKAVREANVLRRDKGLPSISHVYCNAHARRKFKEAEVFGDEARFFIDAYKELYVLENQIRGRPPDRVLAGRRPMAPIFESLRERAIARLPAVPSKSALGKAYGYFLENYEGLTAFLTDPELPIDNNAQERLLRNPVIGRKTWYGTHSRRGAKTAAILFSLVESCKLNGVNPREYFKCLVADLHRNKDPYSPHQFKVAPRAT